MFLRKLTILDCQVSVAFFVRDGPSRVAPFLSGCLNAEIAALPPVPAVTAGETKPSAQILKVTGQLLMVSSTTSTHVHIHVSALSFFTRNRRRDRHGRGTPTVTGRITASDIEMHPEVLCARLRKRLDDECRIDH